MIGDDPVLIGCCRIRDLKRPDPTSVTHVCEWPGCDEVIWVHPDSVAIALAEHGQLICLDHLGEIDEPIYMGIHPLQRAGIEAIVRDEERRSGGR